MPHQRFQNALLFADRRGTKVTGTTHPCSSEIAWQNVASPKTQLTARSAVNLRKWKINAAGLEKCLSCCFLFAEHNFSHWFDIEAIDPTYVNKISTQFQKK